MAAAATVAGRDNPTFRNPSRLTGKMDKTDLKSNCNPIGIETKDTNDKTLYIPVEIMAERCYLGAPAKQTARW